MTYGGNAPSVWWQQNKAKLSAIRNLDVWTISGDQSKILADIAERTMRIQVTLDAHHIWLTAGETALELSLEKLQ